MVQLGVFTLRRMIVAIIMGAICGGICLLGAPARFGGWAGNEVKMVGLWYNRFIMGILIGFAGVWEVVPGINRKAEAATSWFGHKAFPWIIVLLRGMFLGFMVSFNFFLTTSFHDVPTMVIGFGYGLVIDWLATLFAGQPKPAQIGFTGTRSDDS